MGVVPIDENRLAVCVNHETPEMSRSFPGWTEALRERRAMDFIREHPEAVAVMRASVGVSVLELERNGARWRLVADSTLNRRITADTPMEIAGPAANHPWLGGSETAPGRALGTFNNCAAGTTPWGTYLTAEENTNDFFGNGAEADFEPLLERANDRLGMRRGPSAYRWEAVDDRFDMAKNPTESMKFGWIVEIDPLDPNRPIKKRTALGRFRHEGAETVLDAIGRPVVYMGDDSGFEYFYKFIGNRTYDANNPGDTDTLLDDGTLYVAKLNDDGTGEWLPLVYGLRPELTESNEFFSQADVVMRCREAADLLGATPLDRPEDVAIHPHDGRVYLSCTQGTNRGLRRPPPPTAEEPAEAQAAVNTAGAEEADDTELTADTEATEVAAVAEEAEDALAYPAPDAANPRGPNPFGHILEFSEAGGDPSSVRFSWEVFILAGDPAERGLASVAIAGRLGSAVAYYAGRSDSNGLSAFACPDNLGFDTAGNLWIVTDGAQPNQNNNGCFVCPTSGEDRGAVKQFMSGPVGAEISGCTFSPDGETLFLTVQHPGSGSSIDEPSSHWPGGGDTQPLSSLIAVRSIDSSGRFPS
jgi:secreted PhoX family phosphatase